MARPERVLAALALAAGLALAGAAPGEESAAGGDQARRRVTVGVSENPPLIFTRDGTVLGFAADVLRSVAEAEGWDLAYVTGDWRDIQDRLATGAIDLVPVLSYTPERVVLFDFSRQPLLVNWGIVHARPRDHVETVEDLADRRVAMKGGDSFAEAFATTMSDNDLPFTVVEVATYRDALAAVDDGRADAAVVSRVAAVALGDRYRTADTGIFLKPTVLRVAATKGRNGELLGAIDRQIRRQRADPRSDFSRAVRTWLEPAAADRLMPWAIYGLLGLGAGAAAFGGTSLWLRREVRARTAALRRANRELAAQRAQVDSVIEGNADAIVVLDRKGVALFANHAAATCFGKPREAIVGATMGLPLAGEGRAEVEIVRPDGSYLPVEIRAQAFTFMGQTALLASIRDVTERRAAERAAEESRERFEQTFRSAAHGMALVSPDGRWRVVNERLRAMLGLGEPVLLARDLAAVTEPEDRPALARELARLAAGEIPSATLEMRFLRADGTGFPALFSAGLVHDEDGEPDGLVAHIVDTSEIKAVEDQLRQAQKMDALGQLTGGVAHDFNNILGVVLGNLQLVEAKLEDARMRRQIGRAITATQRGADLTRRLLAFSRRQDLTPSVVAVNELIGDLAAMLGRTLGSAIALELHLAEAPWPVRVDAGQLDNALTNLCINARDAMPDGGTLTLETGNVTFETGYRDSTNDIAEGDYVAISVTDTGTGMPASVRERIFEPFFTTKPKDRGTGLGMSMVLGFVKQSGGHIKLYSEEGLGTTIRLFFPRSEAAEAPARPADGEAEGPMPGGSERVLVVDDEPDIRATVCALLESLGYRCAEAGSAAEALDLLGAGGEIDLVLTDVVMPGGMSGAQLVHKLRLVWPDLPCILHSGFTEQALSRRRVLDGRTRFLPKPTSNEVMARTVRAVLDAPRGAPDAEAAELRPADV